MSPWFWDLVICLGLVSQFNWSVSGATHVGQIPLMLLLTVARLGWGWQVQRWLISASCGLPSSSSSTGTCSFGSGAGILKGNMKIHTCSWSTSLNSVESNSWWKQTIEVISWSATCWADCPEPVLKFCNV
jgi:hypothetical protein